MKKSIITFIFFICVNRIYSQNYFYSDHKISDSTSATSFSEPQIEVKNNKIYIVYYNDQNFIYELLDQNLERIIINKPIREVTSDIRCNVKLRVWNNDQFSLYWYHKYDNHKLIYQQTFDWLGNAINEKQKIANLDNKNYYVSESLNADNETGIIYQSNSNIYLKYFSENKESDSIKILEVNELNDYFSYSANFLDDGNIIIHWVNNSSTVYSLRMSKDGERLSDTLKTESPDSTYYISELKSIASGNRFGIIWHQYDDNKIRRLYFQNFSLNGEKIGEVLRLTDEESQPANYLDQYSAGYDDDNLAVAWSDISHHEEAAYIYIQMIDRYGNKTGANQLATSINNDLGDLQKNAAQFTPDIEFIQNKVYMVWENFTPRLDQNWSVYMNVLKENQSNQPPVFKTVIEDQKIFTNDTLKLDIPEYYDPNNDELGVYYQLDNENPLPGWLKIDYASKQLIGMPKPQDIGKYTINLIAYDPYQMTDTVTFNVDVVPKFNFNRIYEGPNVDLEKLNHFAKMNLVTSDTAVCPGTEIILGNSIVIENRENVSYDWSVKDKPEISLTDEAEYLITKQESIIVKVTDEWLCQISDTFKVQLLEVPSIEIASSDTLCLNDQITLDAGNNDHQYLWSTGDKTSSITVKETGKYLLETTNASGCKSIDSVYVAVCTGIYDNTIKNTVLYPNPVKSILTIKFTEPFNQAGWIHIINSDGKRVYQSQIPAYAKNEIFIDVSFLPEGIYQIIIFNNNNSLARGRILVQ